MATKGGARVLGRNDTGTLEADKAADIVAYNLSDIAYAGCHNPLTSLVYCGNSSLVDMTIVNGKVVVKNVMVLTVSTQETAIKAHSHASN
ncbi:MAG: amidohydrolase family protein [Fusobacteriales bacterium]|jgi:cytosine/adenosine deaminase-related metal-dependent hydrolase|nr:amidohydrolase family protein [Fusobacteriales bacterium]